MKRWDEFMIWMTILIVACAAAFLFAFKAIEEAEQPEGVPTPPPGYEYCTNEEGTTLGFCKEGT